MKKVLAIDIGGTNLKVLATGQTKRRKTPSGPKLTAELMVKKSLEMAKEWDFDAVSIGFPGPVVHDKPLVEPVHLGGGWVGFDYAKAFGCPVKMMNDAAMQALGSYEGGRMLFLGLGTGLGSAMIIDGDLEPMELGHLPYKKGRTFEDYVGTAALTKKGKKQWRKDVLDVIERLQHAMQPEYVVVGGGNAKLLKKLPKGVRMGGNAFAFTGGFRMWNPNAKMEKAPESGKRLSTPAPSTATSHQKASGQS